MICTSYALVGQKFSSLFVETVTKKKKNKRKGESEEEETKRSGKRTEHRKFTYNVQIGAFVQPLLPWEKQ